jgi:hypothetical protein
MNTTTLNMTTLDGGVIIKRGEGGGSTPPSGGESAMEYWDISANNGILSETALFFLLVKDESEYGINILSVHNLTTSNINPIAIALDRSIEIVLEGNKMSVGAALDGFGLADFTQFGWESITKEEFYNLE